jgi:hypothetical protein
VISSVVSSSVVFYTFGARGREPCRLLHLRNCLASLRVGLLSQVGVNIGELLLHFWWGGGPCSWCVYVLFVE